MNYLKHKTINTLVALLLTTIVVAQNWTQTAAGVISVNLNSVCFVTDQQAIAVGKTGTILKSTDAGVVWGKINHGLTTSELWAVQFPTSTTGYVAGDGGTVLKSTDGGTTWINISANLPSNVRGTGILLGMNFKDANNGFIIGNPGLILQTIDGGATWYSRNSVTTDGYLRSIDFTNETTAYVVGNAGMIKKSTDSGLTWNAFTPSTDPVDPPVDQYVGFPSFPFGVNLSGGEFGGYYMAQGDPYPGIYGTHYAYPVASQLDYFKGKGMNLIRVPFRWERVQRDLNGSLYMDDVNKIKELVVGANQRGMKIFIDMHNFGRRGTSESNLKLIDGAGSGVTRYHLADAWKKLAIEFKDLNLWGYDIMNEPHDMASTSSWYTIAQEVINAIRTVDTNTPIIISGDSWSSSIRWVESSDNLKSLNDPSNKLIYQAHQYFDNNASGSYSGTYASEGATAQTGVERVTPFVNWLKANKKKGFVGEYGMPVDKTADINSWALVMDNMLKFLQANAVPGTYWSTGTRWGGNKLSADPNDSPDRKSDRPQMLVLEKYKLTNAVQ